MKLEPRWAWGVLVAAVTLGGAVAASAAVTPPPIVPLEVLAGSELDDVATRSVLDELRQSTGVEFKITPTGSLSGAAELKTPDRDAKEYDAAWFATDAYLELFGVSRKQTNAIMRSPVVLGLRPEAAKRLEREMPLSWERIARLAEADRLSFAMTNPVKSNSGFAATHAVADVGGPDLVQGFLSGLEASADTSGLLKARFDEAGDQVDGIVNYESTLLSDFERGTLVPVYPSDGVVEATYPLVSFNGDESKEGAAYKEAVDWLRSARGQRLITHKTQRRPSDREHDGKPFEPLSAVIPYPGAQLPARLGEFRKLVPDDTIFVVDTSGSMGYEVDPGSDDKTTWLDVMTAAINDLIGAAGSRTPKELASFHPQETVKFLAFDSDVSKLEALNLDTSAGAENPGIRSYLEDLVAGGGTATYDGLIEAYKASSKRPDFTDIVMFTDGNPHGGTKKETDFAALLTSLQNERKAIPPLTVIRFGPAAELDDVEADMERIVRLTLPADKADEAPDRVHDAGDEGLFEKVLQQIRLG